MHLLRGEYLRFSHRQRAPVDLAQVFDFLRDGQRIVQVFAQRDHAVVSQQTGLAVAQCFQREVGKILFAEDGVRRAADGVAARDGDVVVDGGHVAAQAGDGGSEGGVHVQHRADLGAGIEDVAMEAPFAGGLAALQHLAVLVDQHQVLLAHLGHGQGGRRDEDVIAATHRGVARRAAVEAEFDHAAGGVE